MPTKVFPRISFLENHPKISEDLDFPKISEDEDFRRIRSVRYSICAVSVLFFSVV